MSHADAAPLAPPRRIPAPSVVSAPGVPGGEPAGLEEIKRKTLFYERLRALAGGTLETAATTFLLLVAVKHFQAGGTAKGLIAAGGSLGMLLSLLVVHVVARHGWRPSRAAACLAALGACGFAAPALFPCLPLYVAGSMFALLCGGSFIPLLTQMYQDNYPEQERGRLFASTIVIRIGTAIVFGYFVGVALTEDLGRYRGLLGVFSAALLASAACLWHCPTEPLRARGGAGPLHAFHWIRDDPLFLRTLIVWMLIGFSNMLMTPLRVDYLANPKYELSYAAVTVATMTTVIPNVVRLFLSPVWGWLFDHVNFFRVRIAVNAAFAVGILAFFTGEGWTGLVVGAAFYGVASAGADVAWSLWVTKLAPPDRVAEYMSVHTFMTGARGVVAPLAAFWLASQLSLATLGFSCAALIVVASALLIPEARAEVFKRHRTPVTEEVAE